MKDNLFENVSSPSAEVSGEWLTAHCDGGSRGNPGPSGFGAVIEDAQGRILAELSEFLGIQTNNYAEYSGLLAVLKWAVGHNTKRLRVVSDSELMVKQMQGKYKVASPILRPLWEEAKQLARHIGKFEMLHTLRGGNKSADRLANEAMDKGMKRLSAQKVGDAGKTGNSGKAGASPSQRLGKPATDRAASQPTAKPPRQILEGYVKDGVIHLLGGELPDGIFVKIIRE